MTDLDTVVIKMPTLCAAPCIKRRLIALGIAITLICVAFMGVLASLLKFALAEERNSYLLIVPAISAYFLWTQRRNIQPVIQTTRIAPVLHLLIGSAALILSQSDWSPITALSLQVLALLNFLSVAAFALLGSGIMRQFAFPWAFLIFAVPVPLQIAHAIETFLQYASAEATSWMFALCGLPYFRDGRDFQLPGVSIRVAQECSGYNSTFALFVVSIVAGFVFLKSKWRRCALTLAIIPLAILRNAFRITTVSLLCVHVDPRMIDSYIHRQGGPLFFAASLIPFLFLLWCLRRAEISKTETKKVI